MADITTGKMYDKITIYADASSVGGGWTDVPHYLSDGKEVELDTGEIRTFGHIGNMRVSVSGGGVRIVGSLPKFLCGANVWGLTKEEVGDAITKLEDTLHISLQDAKVTTMELAQTFSVDCEVWEYLNRLGNMPRMQRVQTSPHTLTYTGSGKNSPKKLVFYDKEAELKDKGETPPYWIKDYGLHLLRYELRYESRLSKQVKEPCVYVSMLPQEDFYNKMVGQYKENYYAITKQNQIETIPMGEITKVSDAYDVWVARLMQQVGATQAEEFLAELKRADVFKNKSDYTGLKKKIMGVSKKANVCVNDELVEELNRNVEYCDVL